MKNNLPDEVKIACCNCCLLAESLKDCQACPFNLGLVYKALEAAKTLPVTIDLTAQRLQFIQKINTMNGVL